MKDRLAAKDAEIEQLHSMSTVEMMCENENVNQHVREWEARCLKAEAEIERLREWLRRLEWCAGTLSEEPSCPACGMWMSSGHKPDCRLNLLLEGGK